MFNRAMVCVALTVVAMCASAANATLYYNETFSYPDGNLAGQDSWAAHSGAGSSPVQVTSGAAILAQGAGSREDVNKVTGSTLGAGQTWYSAFNLTVSSAGNVPLAGTAPAYFAHFYTNSTTFRGKIFAVADTASGRDWSLAISNNANTPPASGFWSTGFLFSQTVRVISSYNFDTGLAQMWINATQQSDPSVSPNDVAPASALTAYALRQADSSDPDPGQKIDNLCVADNFLDAVNCTPEPGTAGLLALGALGLIRRRR